VLRFIHVRCTAAALIVLLLLPAAAAVARPAAKSCCCGRGVGASCPMKRPAPSCTASALQPAGAAVLPILGMERAVLVECAVAAVDLTGTPCELPRFHFAARSASPPEPPPPKRA
jgi:hypothetical protein